jgi:hypothetical protein
MMEAGVDFITTCVDQNSVLSLKQEMARQGMDATVVLPQGYADTEFVASNASILEGDMLATFVRPIESNIEGTGMELFLEWMDETGGKVNDYSLQGWIGAHLAVSGLLAAGPQFDQATVIEATNQFTAYTADGMLATPVNWTLAHGPFTSENYAELDYECAGLVFVRDGAFELHGDPEQPSFCFDPGIEDWHEPTPMSFD